MAPKQVAPPATPSRPGVKSNPSKIAADQRNILKSLYGQLNEVDQETSIVPPETGLKRRRKPQRRVSGLGIVTSMNKDLGPI